MLIENGLSITYQWIVYHTILSNLVHPPIVALFNHFMELFSTRNYRVVNKGLKFNNLWRVNIVCKINIVSFSNLCVILCVNGEI